MPLPLSLTDTGTNRCLETLTNSDTGQKNYTDDEKLGKWKFEDKKCITEILDVKEAEKLTKEKQSGNN